MSTSEKPVEGFDSLEENVVNELEESACKAPKYGDFHDNLQGEEYIELLQFKHFTSCTSFSKSGVNGLKKEISNFVPVSVVMRVV